MKICGRVNGYYKGAFFSISKLLITISMVCQQTTALGNPHERVWICAYAVGCNDDQNELIVAGLLLDCKVATMCICMLL